MKANRFTEEQIVRALKEVETGGKKAAEQQRELGINAAT
jgi:putative transposase